ncbi:hypothetical protein [Rubellimicrobium roseum]|uniref:Uncharacterized protein n=1 Tax=Rubellimicrobium roseum TaxID=687525 RepID=A0A5C4NQK8_9RHOB|nr:hypothetical protein [Rubellimicrobium roseum]TNC74679.1 hypothetical protein FHG71_00640 [Rubellimicrobium roseum]
MTPFLPPVDHRIASPSLPYEERRTLRRSAPERLRFDLPAPGTPVAPRALAPAPPVRAPSRLRVRIGLALMAWGRRLAMPSQGP